MNPSWKFVFALSFLLLNFTFSLASSSCPFGDGEHQHHAHHDHDHHSDAAQAGEGASIAGEHVHDDHHLHSHSHEEPPVHGRQLHDHDHDDLHHHHHHSHHHDHSSDHEHVCSQSHDGHRLAEEIAEEEELQLYGFKSPAHLELKHFFEDGMSPLGLWLQALGCSLLVSMASLICLILLPLIVAKGKPSRIVVDSLAAFGAGAMLGDAFLHQLPHALGSSSGHSHSHGVEHGHMHDHHGHNHPNNWGNFDGTTPTPAGGHGHAHSIQDLSVGLAVLAGIILFFIVEKIVRQLEKLSSSGMFPWAHHHHHHHGHHHHDRQHQEDVKETHPVTQETSPEKETGDKEDVQDHQLNEKNTNILNSPLEGDKTYPQNSPIRKRVKTGVSKEDEAIPEKDISDEKLAVSPNKQALASNLILGYLNLFSDGVHNFTDGMALGSAFLNHGSIGGWSRTLFLLAHELPQEVGDFGILVQSGFTVPKALAFNFLSALVALAGTAMALLMGGNLGHSSLIEGFTAGGFIYIAVAGVLPEMHQHGTSTRITLLQLLSLGLGMSVALLISLAE